MPRYIMKQPNNLYCVWSTVSDSPVMWNAAKEELYKEDYISITNKLMYGNYLKEEVDKAISYGYEFEGKNRPHAVSNITKKDFAEFLKDIGSKYTVNDFFFCDDDEETEGE